jgi:hypothetical protein
MHAPPAALHTTVFTYVSWAPTGAVCSNVIIIIIITTAKIRPVAPAACGPPPVSAPCQHPQTASKPPLPPCSNAAGTPWSCCPRSTLKRALQQLQDKHQLRLMVGFELEFILLCRTQEATSSSSSSSSSSSDSWREVDQSQYCHSGALDSSAAGGWGGSCGEASVDVRLRAVRDVNATQCMLWAMWQQCNACFDCLGA